MRLRVYATALAASVLLLVNPTRLSSLVTALQAPNMAERLIWTDDFAYANKAALDAVYPYQYDNAFTGVSSTLDLAASPPPGYATGIDSKVGANDDYAGFFSVTHWLIAPTSRYFHVRGVWKDDTSDSINPSGGLMNMAHGTVTDYFGQYWQLSTRLSDPTELLFTAAGGDGTSGSYPTAAYSSGYVAGILTPNAANQIDVIGYLSTLTETSPGSGVYNANADGSITVTVNGVTFVTYTGVVWNFDNTQATPLWNQFDIWPAGTMSGLRIWDEVPVTVPADSSTPCCGDTTTPTGPGGTGSALPPNPFVVLPEWIRGCVGGGVVPTATDPTDPEAWT